MAARKRKAEPKGEADLRSNPERVDGDLAKLSRDNGRSEYVVAVEPVEYVTGPIVAEIPAKVRE